MTGDRCDLLGWALRVEPQVSHNHMPCLLLPAVQPSEKWVMVWAGSPALREMGDGLGWIFLGDDGDDFVDKTRGVRAFWA